MKLLASGTAESPWNRPVKAVITEPMAVAATNGTFETVISVSQGEGMIESLVSAGDKEADAVRVTIDGNVVYTGPINVKNANETTSTGLSIFGTGMVEPMTNFSIPEMKYHSPGMLFKNSLLIETNNATDEISAKVRVFA